MANIWGKWKGKPALYALHIPQSEVPEYITRAVLAGWSDLVTDFNPKQFNTEEDDDGTDWDNREERFDES